MLWGGSLWQKGAGSFEHSNETSDSINCGISLEQFKNYQVSKGELLHDVILVFKQ
jgi:hypothetical protein